MKALYSGLLLLGAIAPTLADEVTLAPHDIDGWARVDPHDIGADEVGSDALVCPTGP
jgi:hypothetical protein